MAKKVKIAKKQEIKHDPVREAILKFIQFFKDLSKQKYFYYGLYGVGAIAIIVLIYSLYKNSTKPRVSYEADVFLLQAIYAISSQDTVTAPALLDTLITKFSRTTSGMRAYYHAGVYYLKMGDQQRALRYFKKFLSTPVDDKLLRTFAYAQLSDIYVDMKKYGTAINYMKKAYNSAPEGSLKAYYYYKTAKIYYQSGNLQKTKKLLSSFEKKFPKSALKQAVAEELNFIKGMLGEVN
ncbi:MAG: tetratricopeptide repeat protein [candidate division WOR-3 bacterium]